MGGWFFLLKSLLLAAALSVDAFAASFAYGADRIRIPPLSGLVVAGVCTGVLAFSLTAGQLIAPLLPEGFPKTAGFICLFILGGIKLFDSGLKAVARRISSSCREVRFRLFSLRFILQIYGDCIKADQDCSRRLSAGEAAALAAALSLDGLAAGFGAGMHLAGLGALLQTLLISLLTTLAAVGLGSLLGRRLAQKLSFDVSWVSGAMLILLAFLKR